MSTNTSNLGNQPILVFGSRLISNPCFDPLTPVWEHAFSVLMEVPPTNAEPLFGNMSSLFSWNYPLPIQRVAILGHG